MDGVAVGQPGAPDEVVTTRVPALDGLRGLAVAAVIVNHLRPSALPGGWLGVDVFFVLSGFLITSLLLSEHRARGRIDLLHFYSRRARRLLPALFLLLAVVAIVGRVVSDAPGFGSVRGDGFAALGYVANWHFVVAGASYFGEFAPSPLRHLWSLAVEEQFYLVWPLVLIVVLRRHGARAVGIVALVLAIVSALAMAVAYGGGAGSARVYFGTDTHAHGILLGCALAALMTLRRPWRFPPAFACAALVGLGACMYALDGIGPAAYRGGIAAVGLLTALVIAGVMGPGAGGPVSWFLGLRPLTALGRISYGLYLWHWPILIFLTASRVGLSGWALVMVQLGCTFAFALASFFLVERPVLAGWPRPRWSWIAVPSAVVVSAALLAAFAPNLRAPFAEAQQQASARAVDTVRPRPRAPVGVASRRDDRGVVVVVGDSVAYTLFPGLRAHEKSADLYFLTAAATGCPLDIAATEYRHENTPLMAPEVPPECDWPRRWPAMIERTRPDVVVGLWGLWDAYDHEVNGQWLGVGSPEWHAHMENALERALGIATARGARMIVLTSPYVFGVSDARINALDEVYRTVAARHPDRLRVVDIRAAMEQLRPQRWDGVHFTVEGAEQLSAAIVPQIAQAARPPKA